MGVFCVVPGQDGVNEKAGRQRIVFDCGQSCFFYEPVLEESKGDFDSAFSLWRIGCDEVDIKLMECTFNLCIIMLLGSLVMQSAVLGVGKWLALSTERDRNVPLSSRKRRITCILAKRVSFRKNGAEDTSLGASSIMAISHHVSSVQREPGMERGVHLNEHAPALGIWRRCR